MKPLVMTDDAFRKLHARLVAGSPSVKSAEDAAREIAERLQRFRPVETRKPAEREPDEDFAAPEPAPPEPAPSIFGDVGAWARGFWQRQFDKEQPPKPPQVPRRGGKPKLVVDNDNEPPKKPIGPKE